METISDEYMMQMLDLSKNYCVVILKAGPNKNNPESEKIVWEHARRNFALRAAGILAVVCPIADGSDVAGIGVFNAEQDEVKKIMDEDPGVRAGIFVYKTHVCRSFPGDGLPFI